MQLNRTMRGVLVVATLLLARHGVVERSADASQTDVIHERNVAVPMRDGVVLRADVIRPSQGRVPTLVYRTPYGKDDALKEYTTFTRASERGYAVVAQDVRGRYASDGEFRPYENEGRDGYDTIEWAARQPWSNGRVGTFGLSYPGAVQWLAAVENPPHLEAMVPAMTFSTPQNFFYSGGTWDMSWFDWIWRNIAPDVRTKNGLPNQTRQERAASRKALEKKVLETVPLDRVEELRDVAPYYYEWLHHPPEDPFWDFAELRNKYSRTRAAVLNLSGWHDDNYGPEGATTNYAGLVRARGGDTSRAALLIGPWTHGVDSTARTRFGERDFGSAAVIDYDAVVLSWMDRYVRGNGTNSFGFPVRYFVMGDNRWKESSVWPPPGRAQTYYLSPANGGAAAGGLIEAAPTRPVSASMLPSDPDNPVINKYDSAGAHDYRALTDRRDVLTFDTAPLAGDVEITGSIRARMYISCDCRDTDVWVRLLDVAPDGGAYNLMSPGVDVVRASYRHLDTVTADAARTRELLQPGEIYELTFDRPVTSNLFQRGHRVRVQISTSFFPNFSRNLHSGDLETVSSRAQRATIRVYHDRGHASQVSLPVVAR
jgi:putative CocE/NonD family hydrolase